MVLRQIMDRMIIGGVLVGSAVAYEAAPVLICGILVGGSAIPLGIKAYRDKKRGTGSLEALLDRRLGELEERIYGVLSEMEYRTAQLVESVEERIDFAEQLLAQGREKVHKERPMGLPIVTPIKVRPVRGAGSRER
jgi:hypothetical protein